MAGPAALLPSTFLRQPAGVSPRNVADTCKGIFLCQGCINTARADLLQPLTLRSSTRRLDRVRSPPRRGAHAALRRSLPTAPPCAALCAFSSAALRLRLDVRLPLPLPAEACRPRDVTCFSLLRTSLPDPAPRAPAQPGLTGPAVRCALLRVSGSAGPRYRGPALLPGSALSMLQGSGPVDAPEPQPCRARHHPPRSSLGSSPPLGRFASQRLRRQRLRRSGFAALWTPPLSRTCVHW